MLTLKRSQFFGIITKEYRAHIKPVKNNIKKDDKSIKVLENEEQSSICFSSLMVKKEKN